MDMPSHPFETDSAVQRDAPRNSIFLGAVLWLDGEEQRHDVRVRNISASGMMIDFMVQTDKDTRVKADIRNVGVVSGYVAWSTGTRMGVRFDRDIDPEKARLKPAVATVPGILVPIVNDRRPGLALR